MEIVIHGTKGGRKIFTPNKVGGLFDVTSDSPNTSAIGQNAYAIRFILNNAIFSKYKIIRDVRGDKRTGFIAFSLFISNTEKLSGSHIITLLDKVSEEYCQKYVIDNNLNEVTEDWTFVERLSSEYESKLSKVSNEDSENVQSGNLDEAFVYYSTDTELQKYFDIPYQEEYLPHRQIFFISNALKDNKPENPLNALRNSGIDLTVKIDLENPFYKLREYHGTAKNGISISIKNSKGRQFYNKDKIYRKEELIILYSKKNHKAKQIIGSLLNSEEIREHLIVSNDNKIDVLKDIILDPIVKTITFEVVKKDGSKVSDALITCKSNFQLEKTVSNNQVTFSGEELNEKWIVSAKNGDTFYSNNHIIDFDKDINGNVKIDLNEKRVLKIIAKEVEGDKDAISIFKVWVQGKGNTERNEVEFVNDELDKTYNITVESDGYQRSEVHTYHPSSDGNKTIYFDLRKSHKKNSDTEKWDTEKDTDNDINFGKNKKRKFYQKPIFIISSIVIVLFISFGIWGLSNHFDKDTNNDKLLTADQIETYLNGDALILDTLKVYKGNWVKQNPIKMKDDDGFLSLFLPKKDTNSSLDIENWQQNLDSIESAINKRNLVDRMEFKRLKKENFSNLKSFENTINNIKEDKYEVLKKELGEVSSLTLTQIEGKIKDILKTETKKVDNSNYSTDSNNSESNNNSTAIASPTGNKDSKSNESSIGNTNSKGNTEASVDQGSNNSKGKNTANISEFLKSGNITKFKLEEYKNQEKDPNLLKSIDLALKLWELDGTTNNSYSSYLKQIKDNSNLKVSNLKKFVTIMCEKEKPKYIKTIAANKLLTLDELELKIN